MKNKDYRKIIISIFLSILLMMGLIGILGKIALNKTLLDPTLYSQTLRENDFFALYPTLLGNLGALGELNTLNPAWSPEFIDQVGEGTFVNILGQLLPMEWMQQQTDSAFQGLIDYLKGNALTWIPGLDFSIIREEFTGNQSNIVSARLLQMLPSCNADQQSEWETIMIQQIAQSIPFCRPPVGVTVDAQTYIQEQLSMMVEVFPDRLEINQLVGEEIWSGTVLPALSGYRNLMRTISAAPWLGIVVGSILGWMHRKSIAATGKWLAASMIGAGLTVFGLMGAGLVLVNQIALQVSTSVLPEAPATIAQMLSGIMLQLGSTTAFWLALTGLGSFVAGVSLLLVSSLLPGEPEEGTVSIKLKNWKSN